MQWLTAILAFATTMLIFAIIVSTIVETIHRALGSRTYGQIMMLEHFYDEVIADYLNESQRRDFGKEQFIEKMIKVRGSAVSNSSINKDGSVANSNFLSTVVGFLPNLIKSIYSKISGASALAQKLNKSQWQLLSHLPVITFMERLGSSVFSDALKDKKINADDRDLILKDIAHKFVAYGQESGLYFERKARTISVAVAFFVAWTFYVHPEELIRTYLEKPEIAAKISQMSDDAQTSLEEMEKLRKTLENGGSDSHTDLTPEQLNKLLSDVKENLDEAKKKSQLLVDAGAPIGWPANSNSVCLGVSSDSSECKYGIPINLPNTLRDVFWLLMGGLLIGLGAPFWAKAIGQIKQGQSTISNLTDILKPGQIQPIVATVKKQTVGTEDKTPITTEAFNVASVTVPTEPQQTQ